ncbi:hypothetical protein RND81_10G068200 [Saponaria officinalis]|uniref:Uncharacterized protein n=1 Tax=Saponaria officinalis TaxID=3572 RepID=A0AAW1I065_SAPOF
MAVSMSLTSDSYTKSKQINQFLKNKRVQSSSSPNHHQMCSTCCESKLAVIDLIILIAVIGAFGFLLFPYVKFTYLKFAEICSLVYYVLEDEICENPLIYGFLSVSMVCVALAAWAIVMCTTRKCANPSCRGLWKAAEFDIQLETEECVKNSNSIAKEVVRKDLFELPRDHHRELEAELKKIAPPNGRAVLVFRARCGCSVGRMEVPGPKKVARKIKK